MYRSIKALDGFEMFYACALLQKIAYSLNYQFQRVRSIQFELSGFVDFMFSSSQCTYGFLLHLSGNKILARRAVDFFFLQKRIFKAFKISEASSQSVRFNTSKAHIRWYPRMVHYTYIMFGVVRYWFFFFFFFISN